MDALYENSLYEIAPDLEGGVRFGRHSHNIMLSGKFVQRTPAVEDLTSKHHGTA